MRQRHIIEIEDANNFSYGVKAIEYLKKRPETKDAIIGYGSEMRPTIVYFYVYRTRTGTFVARQEEL